jgi:hypothetical protein
VVDPPRNDCSASREAPGSEASVKLLAGGAKLSYLALTAFYRRHGIGYQPPTPAGQYDFAPGEELQHDTSSHEVEVGWQEAQSADDFGRAVLLALVFFQCYPTFQPFDCKAFLTDALRYMGGATASMMIDNTHVVVAARQRTRDGAGAGDGRLWRAFRFRLCGTRQSERVTSGKRSRVTFA